MKFETWLSPVNVPQSSSPPPKTGVVIDVLRATTVATTALAAGARRLMTCREIEQAFALKEASSVPKPLLCGERHCHKIEGFDFGNSPSEFSPAAMEGRDLVMTTTNGTRAVESASDCQSLILAAFVNLSVVAEALIERHQDSTDVIRLVCAGTDGKTTMEDVLFAGALLSRCHRRLSDSPRFHEGPIELLDDAGSVALAMWQHAVSSEGVVDAATLADRFTRTSGGRNLVNAGHAGDLVDCASIDVFDLYAIREKDSAFFTVGRPRGG